MIRSTLHKKRNKSKSNKHQKAIILSHQSKKTLIELPQDIIFSEILTKLPVNSLTRFKSVSKTWNFIISTPNFIKSHLNYTKINPFVPTNCLFIKSSYYFYILNYDAYDKCPDDCFDKKGLTLVKSLNFSDNCVNTFLIGSCDGLVCFGRGNFYKGFDYYFNVYNPLIGKKLLVLDPLGNFQGNLIYGFGFVLCKDDYLMFIGGLQRSSSENFVYLYSLRCKEWKKMGVFDESEFLIFMGGRGVLVNETLHWDVNQVRTSRGGVICGFDLKEERFMDIRVPEVFVDGDDDGVGDGDGDRLFDFKVCEIGGCLCVWGEDMHGRIELWKLKSYGVWDSWMKVFKIDMIFGVENFYGCTEKGKVLVKTNDGSLLFIVGYDESEPECVSLVKDLGDIEVVSYIRSPVSPFQ